MFAFQRLSREFCPYWARGAPYSAFSDRALPRCRRARRNVLDNFDMSPFAPVPEHLYDCHKGD